VAQLVVVSGTIGILGNAPASALPDGLSSGERLAVGTTGDYPPLTAWSGQEAGPSGFSIAVMKALGADLNLVVDFVPTTWQEMSQDLANGRFRIAVGGISASVARSREFLLSVPLLVDGKVPLVRCEDQDTYTSLEAINQPSCRVVENQGGTNHEFAKRMLPRSQLIVKEDNKLPFKALAMNEADVMITDRIEARYRSLISNGTLCVANLKSGSPLTTQFKVFMLRKGDEALLRQLNTAILGLQTRLDDLKRQYKLTVGS
jgi:cyclohexadienyl dehydratase